MHKLKMTSFLFIISLLSTEAFAKPRCDTAHLNVCTRELLQGLIENKELKAHWDNGNYITGNLVVDSNSNWHARSFSSVRNIHGWDWDTDNVFFYGNSAYAIQTATHDMIHDVGSYYFAGSWHTIGAPIAVPSTPIINTPTPKPTVLAPQATPQQVPNMIPQPNKVVTAPPLVPTLVPNKVPQPKPTVLAPQATPQQVPNMIPQPNKVVTAPPLVPTLVPNKVPQPNKIVTAPPLVPNKVPTVISHVEGTGNKHSKITLNNVYKKVTINYNHKHKHRIGVSKPKIVQQKTIKTVSLQVANLHYKNAKKIDSSNVNRYLISTVPGDNVAQNHHAILVDHNDRVWRCKLSGLGYRDIKSKGEESIPTGHAETMHFKNSIFSHISNSISINNNCLISVSK